MYPLQAFFLISTLVILPVAWIGGGHTERTGVALYLVLYIVGYLVQDLRIGDLLWGEALADTVFLAGLVWLAVRGTRWWPLVASALQFMAVMLYVSTLLMPGLDPRSGIVAGSILAVLGLYCLLGGVAERFLAGESAASAAAVWTRSRRSPPGRPVH